MKNFLLLLIIGCGADLRPSLLPVNDGPMCEPVTTCNIPSFVKAGGQGRTGDQGVRGLPGKDAASTVSLRGSLKCSQTVGNERFEYETKVFSNDTRLVKCRVVSLSNQYNISDSDLFATNEVGFEDGNCTLEGSSLDCHEPLGAWVFTLSPLQARYVNPNSIHNNTTVEFQAAGCTAN